MKCSRCGKKITPDQAFFGEEGTRFAGQCLCQSCYYKTLMNRKLRYDKRKHEYSKRNQYKKTNLYRTEKSEESKESEESSKIYGKKEDEYKLIDEKLPTSNE